MSKRQNGGKRKLPGWLIFYGIGVAIVGVGVLANSASKAYAGLFQGKQAIADMEPNNSKWGAKFTRQYASWLATQRMEGVTKFGGSETRDYLAENPQLVVVWAGNPFANMYKTPRGHFYAIEDVTATKRRNDKTPGTCWTCKSPDVPRLMAKDGVGNFYKAKFDDYIKEAVNPIGCADCHDNKTMALKITRPALVEAFERSGKDIRKASKDEMRSLVCAQCHVEYYFKGKTEKYLTFPWDDGTSAEGIEKYYEKSGFSDFTHAISGAKMIKIQHPDYEVFSESIHAYSGVSCADCHMPKAAEGKIEFTDHRVRSPLLNIKNTCANCHEWSEEETKNRVFSIQSKNFEMQQRALDAVVTLHLEIADAMKLGATDAELDAPRKLVSKAQMYWDMVAANNGMGFHAPQECARVLDKSLHFASDGRIAVTRIRAKYGSLDPIVLPDISTKEKAQAYIKPFVEAQAAAIKAKEEADKKAGGGR